MPPSGHSHSSHSSHSSHGSSHHSSSSHSSYNSNMRSAHSTSSYRATPTTRPRINQPTGYHSTPHVRHLRHHDYAYYGSGWVDSATGRSYSAGYYDENGNYYRGLTVKSGSDYISEFACEYCGTMSKYTWKEGSVPNCANCGAPLNMVDSFAKDEEVSGSQGVVSTGSYSNDFGTFFNQGFGLFKIVASVGILAVVVMFTTYNKNKSTYYSTSNVDSYSYSESYSDESDVSIFGEDIYLQINGNGSYSIVDEDDAYSKHLSWNSYYESYYDPESDAYLWFNTDVTPNLWQYWYEGYSSKYGDYGWMEHESDGWWIEVDDSDWVAVPAKDCADFWWIE